MPKNHETRRHELGPDVLSFYFFKELLNEKMCKKVYLFHRTDGLSHSFFFTIFLKKIN